MKTASATDVRRNWFRLLDEVADGEVIVIARKGRRIVLRREESRPADPGGLPLPDYRDLLRVPDALHADEWGWEWPGAGGELVAIDRGAR